MTEATAAQPLYPYSDGDRLDNRNTYFYTAYHGRPFLDAWAGSRDRALAALPAPQRSQPQALAQELLPPYDAVVLFAQLERSLTAPTAASDALLYRLVQRFEVTKRIHRTYNARLRATDKAAFRDARLYVRFGELMAAAFEARSELPFLNALLKCLDTLQSHLGELSHQDAACMAALILRERAAVAVVSEWAGKT